MRSQVRAVVTGDSWLSADSRDRTIAGNPVATCDGLISRSPEVSSGACDSMAERSVGMAEIDSIPGPVYRGILGCRDRQRQP
jgi:hypothetical protein